MLSTQEKAFYSEVHDNLEVTLNKILTHGEKVLFDSKVVINTIVDYLSEDHVNVNLSNRYEEYYHVIGKAVIIAEAWLKNYAPDVKHYEETEASIKSYLKNTYGKKPLNH